MEFLETLQRVLSSPSPARLTVGNWSLACQREGEVSIHNADGTRVGGAPSCTAALIVCYGRQCCRWWQMIQVIESVNLHLVLSQLFCDRSLPPPSSLLLQQATILREMLQGFVFEPNRGTWVSMVAETTLAPQFSFGWNEKKGRKFKTTAELTEHKVCLRARVWEGGSRTTDT